MGSPPVSPQSIAAPIIATGTKYCTTWDGGVGWAAAPTTEAVAIFDTLVYPVQVAPFPGPPSELAEVAGALVTAVPTLEVRVVPPFVPVITVPVAVAVPVIVAVTLAGTVPAITDTLAVPVASATGAAQSHTGAIWKSAVYHYMLAC